MNNTQLLDDAGHPSLATCVMMSHHAMRRDLALFASTPGESPGLREEWRLFGEKLHGHHHGEDTGVFPQVLAQAPNLRDVIAGLTLDHTRIDPLLDAPLSLDVVHELSELLRPHLAMEEELVLPNLRAARAFPLPANRDELVLFADGFAWTMFGIEPVIVQAVYRMLPESLVRMLPAARAAYVKRRDALWGAKGAGASTRATPDWLGHDSESARHLR